MGNKTKPSKEELIELTSKGLKQKEIAEFYRVSAKTVQNWNKNYEIKTVSCIEIPPTKEIEELINKKLTRKQIGETYGVSTNLASDWCIKYGFHSFSKETPPKEDLEKLINDGVSTPKIAKKYHADKKTILRWLDFYNLKPNVFEKVSIPPQDELQYLVDKKLTQEEIGKTYGVCGRTVFKWCKTYNIKSKICGEHDLIGKKFGKLTVLYVAKRDTSKPKQEKRYLCRCDCGAYKEAGTYFLLNKITTHCGCTNNNPSKINNKWALSHIGETYNRLTVIDIKKKEEKTGYYLICQCSCGNITKVPSYSYLIRGQIKSCGCYSREKTSKFGATYSHNSWKNKYKWYIIKKNKEGKEEKIKLQE